MNAEQLRWFKSSYSSGGGGECLEAAACPTIVHVRDSKNAQGHRLDVAPAAWSALVTHARRG
ncbi:DUF397 domain-containing protein [Streptomyces laculatispora]|uniref:DUF397 domain-containing protein n=1 Tax=Streptomyces laculatispora TaxID=887464 RepID=A0ABY9I6M0_9ACTN|nr:DUF397 domain-containing protein [Streptomyces laculatispora]WLQ42516.1 DUF397 domain-containing protein [Streptomyces laculatispora]